MYRVEFGIVSEARTCLYVDENYIEDEPAKGAEKNLVQRRSKIMHMYSHIYVFLREERIQLNSRTHTHTRTRT